MSQDRRIKLRQQRKKSVGRQNIVMLAIGAGLVLVAIAAFLSLSRAQAEIEAAGGPSAIPMEVNFPAPEVKVNDLQGKRISLADYAGQVVLYNAWATWCPPCKAEMPTLQAYYDDHKDQGFVVIAIEDGQPINEVADFVEKFGLTFPVWPDPYHVATTAFKSNTLPTSFVIDREGIVRLSWSGAISRQMLEKYVTPLLGQ